MSSCPAGRKLGIGLTAHWIASRGFLGRKMSRFMLRIASHLLHWITERRCPSCGCIEVRRSARRNSFEAALLPILLTRPFRCENCGNRFYGLALRRRVPAPPSANQTSDLPQDLPVLFYGRSKDEEPFREETRVHLLNLRGGLITLATRVEPGQQLILMNVAAEKDQRIRLSLALPRNRNHEPDFPYCRLLPPRFFTNSVLPNRCGGSVWESNPNFRLPTHGE